VIRFGANVYARVFRQEIALILHHASVWSELAGVAVDVPELGENMGGAATLHAWDLAVDLVPRSDNADHAAALAGYLARVLDPAYGVIHERDHIHVEWDARRKPPAIGPAYRTRGEAAPPRTDRAAAS
jgi:hypothetical protein